MSSAALKIKIFNAKGTQLLPIAKSTATVGSADHCDVVFNHSSVQPEHVRAWCEGGRIWVQDLGTPAGTTMNGIRLPPLKPMLVRELDVLKLGECPATMGLEPNLVRAPVVRPQPSMQEFTATDIKPIVPQDPELEKRHDEHERVSRELADLKLQMQMARLEKESGEDLRKELAAAKEGIARLTADNQKLKDSFQHFEADKKNFKRQLEDEVAELKLKALRELKEQHAEDVRRFENWKGEVVDQLAAGLRSLSDQKVKSWNTRPLSKDMIFEWEGDLNHLFKRIILNDRAVSEPALPPVPAAAAGISADAPTVVRAAQTSSRINIKKKIRRHNGDGPWQRIAIGGFILALLMAVAWLASTYWKKEGARSMASEVETAPPAATVQPAAKPEPAKPAQTRSFKKSYTDNVLYTLHYVEAETNADFRVTWLKDFNRAATRDWKISAKSAGTIAALELELIKDLQRLQPHGIARMRQREAQFMRDLKAQLGRKITTDKFMRLKRAFYTRNQVYLTR